MKKNKRIKPTCEVLSSQFEDCEFFKGNSSTSRWPKGKIIWEGEEDNVSKKREPRKRVNFVERRRLLNLKKAMVKVPKVFNDISFFLEVPCVLVSVLVEISEIKVEREEVLIVEVEKEAPEDSSVCNKKGNSQQEILESFGNQEFECDDGYIMKTSEYRQLNRDFHPFKDCFYLKGGSKDIKFTNDYLEKKIKKKSKEEWNQEYGKVKLYKIHGEPDWKNVFLDGEPRNRVRKKGALEYVMNVRAFDNSDIYCNPEGKVVSFGYEAGYLNPVVDGTSQMSSRDMGDLFEEYRVESFSCDFRIVNLENFPINVIIVPYTFYAPLDFIGLNVANYQQVRSVMFRPSCFIKMLGPLGSGSEFLEFEKKYMLSDFVETWQVGWDFRDNGYYSKIGESPVRQSGLFCSVYDITRQNKIKNGIGVVNFFTSELELLNPSNV